MPKYSAKVKYNGNHYFADEVVSGSRVKTDSDGRTWLYDDEEVVHHFVDKDGKPWSFEDWREVWVEVKPESVEQKDEK